MKSTKINSEAAKSKVVEIIRKDRQDRQAHSNVVEINRKSRQANRKVPGKSSKTFMQCDLIKIPEKQYNSSAFYELVYLFLSHQQILGQEVNAEELCEGIVIGSGIDKKYVKVFIEQGTINGSDVKLLLQESREFSCRRCTLFTDGYLANDAWRLVKKADVKVYEKNDLRSYFDIQCDNNHYDAKVCEDEDVHDMYWNVYDECRCPLCSSFNVAFNHSKFNVASAAWGYKSYGTTAGAALEERVLSEQEWECKSCGHSWGNDTH